MDSAKKLETEEQDPLNEVGGRKFLLTVLGIIIFGIFTALGQMEVETYMYLFLGLAGGYGVVNVTQKKMLN